MGNQIITFEKVFDVSDTYAPQPAYKFVPDWYREMENEIPKGQHPDHTITIKRCMPVLDAMTAGYIIPTPCDLYVGIEDGEPVYKSALNGMVNFHPRKQAYKHPQATMFQFPKWTNAYQIKTPKGYSTYFKPPAHNPNPWFEILEGFVDTDTYHGAVNFPFVLLKPNEECLIPAGTPMAQVIPIKRDNWKHQTKQGSKDEHRGIMNHLDSHFFNRYKRFFWQRKEYK